jgi:hypothetical protein
MHDIHDVKIAKCLGFCNEAVIRPNYCKIQGVSKRALQIQLQLQLNL